MNLIRKHYTLSLLSLFLIFAVACEDEERFFIPSSDFVTFGAATSGVTENTTSTLSIPVFASTDGSTSATISISGDAVEGEDYTIVSGTLDFPAGVYSDTLVFSFVDNLESDGSRNIVISITGGGYPNGDLAEHTVTIADDDCPFDLGEFAGDYSVDDPGNPFAPTAATAYTASVAAEGTVDNRILVSGFLDLAAFGLGDRSFFADLSPDLNTPTVTIPAQALVPGVTSGGTPIGVVSVSDGSYVSCTGDMVVDIQVVGLDGNGDIISAFSPVYTLTLTKQ
ncbi:MAG: hypothetical protein AAFX87_11030 [Bacteroidota bacterium]